MVIELILGLNMVIELILGFSMVIELIPGFSMVIELILGFNMRFAQINVVNIAPQMFLRYFINLNDINRAINWVVSINQTINQWSQCSFKVFLLM
ncbi:hypothetical protein M8J76_008689 [Diaphorina citri]|nr:hypothetical protein M8J75_013513 [Diaphorina citri]KAI5736941.1 hypothetical protein M8J76_008689 [Diaphorina citri]